MKRVLIAAIFALWSSCAPAQSNQAIPYMSLDTGFDPSNPLNNMNLLIQELNQVIPPSGGWMYSSGANASSLAFGGLLSAATGSSSLLPSALSSGAGTSIDAPGLSASVYTGAQFQILQGTSGAPYTTGAPAIKIQRIEQIPTSNCNSNTLDNSCNALLSVISQGTQNDQMQVNAIFSDAYSNNTVDAVGDFSIGYCDTSCSGIGTGFYMQGQAQGSSSQGLGGEVRVVNNTSAVPTYQTGGFSGMNGMWITAGGNANSAAGIQVGNAGQKFSIGYGCNSNGTTSACFEDDGSGNTYGLKVNGSETYPIVVGPNAGFTGLGTLTPSANLEVVRQANDSAAIFRITGGAIGTPYSFNFSRSNLTGALMIQGNQSGFEDIEIAPSAGGLAVGTTSAAPNGGILTAGNVSVGGVLGVPQTTWTDTQTCTVGQLSVDASFIYVCTSTNTVKRATLSSF